MQASLMAGDSAAAVERPTERRKGTSERSWRFHQTVASSNLEGCEVVRPEKATPAAHQNNLL
jgi:hypothetical protein